MIDRNKMQQSMRDRVRARAEKHKNQGGMDTLNLSEGVELYKAEKGTAEFDVIPYVVSVDTHPEVKKGEVWYERTYLAHRNIGPEEKAIVCPRTVGKRCPICEEYQRLNKDPDADEDMVKGLKAKERELFNVVMKDGDGAIMVMDISVHLFGLLLEQEILEGEDSNASFAELKGGKTLKVRWEPKTMGKNKFVEAARIDFEDRDDFGKEVLEAAVDLDKILKIMSYEEIEEIFQAGGESEGSGEAGETAPPENERPVRRVIGGNRGSAPKKEDEDNLNMDAPSDRKGKATTPPEEGTSTGGDPCVACDGTGKTSKGKDCPICGGTGVNEEEQTGKGEDAPPPKEKDDKPVRRAIRR